MDSSFFDGAAVALLGAGVGFLGAFSLQRARFVRDDRTHLTELRGAVRLLSGELMAVFTSLEGWVQEGVISTGRRLDMDGWVVAGPTVVAAVDRPEPLTSVYAQIRWINDRLRSQRDGRSDVSVLKGTPIGNEIDSLRDKISEVHQFLFEFEGECDSRIKKIDRRKWQLPRRES